MNFFQQVTGGEVRSLKCHDLKLFSHTLTVLLTDFLCRPRDRLLWWGRTIAGEDHRDHLELTKGLFDFEHIDAGVGKVSCFGLVLNFCHNMMLAVCE